MANCIGCPRSILCQLNGIANMEQEKYRAEAALEKHNHLGPTLYCMRADPCLYGHANVKWDSLADYNFKFCGPIDQILSQRLLNKIIRDKGIKAIITDDPSLRNLLENNLVPKAYARLLHLITPACSGNCKVEGLAAHSFWQKLWGR